ncbi:MAG: ribonuclease E inhibitor RraB [Pseudomonadota bacterium]
MTGPRGFDYAAQRAETERVWADLSARHSLPETALLDLHFEAGPGADAVEFMGWLEDHGYDVEHYPADEDEPEAIEVQTPEMALSPATIHAEERRCTEVALTHGFRPTGWGFMGI